MSRLLRPLKKLAPFAEIARIVDLHFARLVELRERLDVLDQHSNSLNELREGIVWLRRQTRLIDRKLDTVSGINARLDAIVPFQDVSAAAGAQSPEPLLSAPAMVVVTANEVNACHGSGILVERLFNGIGPIISYRSTDSYGGQQEFGDVQFRLPALGLARPDIFAHVSQSLRQLAVDRVFCVPFVATDVLVALAVKETFDVPLYVYMMDDQNLYRQTIPDHTMAELLAKASVRFAISSEMRDAYQDKYRHPVWLLPPLVPAGMLRRKASAAPPRAAAPRGILIGNVWSQSWLDELRRTVRGSGVQIDWYCSVQHPAWLDFDESELRKDGIGMVGSLPERDLVKVIPDYDFTLMPTATSAGKDNDMAEAIARYSLPSRVIFILATSQTPILVLGRRDTCVANFVSHFDLGAVAPYEPAAFLSTVRDLADNAAQTLRRENAWRLAPAFSDFEIDRWLLRTLELGEPADRRFEDLLSVNRLSA